MTTSLLNSVIADFADDMRDKISPSYDYLTEPYILTDATPIDKIRDFPAILIVPTGLDYYTYVSNSRSWKMELAFIGVVKHVKDTDYTSVEQCLNLYTDVVKFLDSGSAYAEDLHNLDVKADIYGNKTNSKETRLWFKFIVNLNVESEI